MSAVAAGYCVRVILEHPDPAFPRLHGRPDRGWVNDPNGCSYIDGRYHVFFQYNPDAPVHAGIKWGHASSADLAHWRQEPIALVNRPGELDSFGCWSGCVVDDAGVPTAVYSAVADDTHRTNVLLARSDREMRVWQQDRKPVARTPDDPSISHVRDPFVFEVDGHRYAIQGAGHTDGGPCILVYGCDDLSAWTELGTLLSGDDPVAAEVAPANIWECPNLVRFADRWVLILSLWRRVDGRLSLAGVRYLLGDLAVGPDGPRFAPTSGGLLDRGPCFYAPAGAARGRPRPAVGLVLGARPCPAGHHGRRLGRARSHSAGNWPWSMMRSCPGRWPNWTVCAATRCTLAPDQPFTAVAYDVELPPDAGRVELWLVGAGDDRIVAAIDVAPSPVIPPRILVDGSMIEVFDGTATPYTTRAYPTTTSRWLLRTARPAALRAWHLGPGPNAAQRTRG